MTITFIVIQCLIHLGCWLLLAAGRFGARGIGVARGLILLGASWPLATYLIRIVPASMTLGALTHLAPWPVAALVALLASRVRRHPLAPVAAICAATAAVIVADLATGGRLQVASVLGNPPHTTYRFVGLGNVGFAVLASTTLLAVGIHLDVPPDDATPWSPAGAVLGVVAVADVAPWLGADVGGILTLLPVFALTFLALAGRRLRLRSLVLAAALAIGGLLVVLGLDLLRPSEAQTHLARFATDTLAGGDVGAAVGRRWSANTRMFTQSAWTWLVLPLTVAIGVAVARPGWASRQAPLARGTRIAVLGALATGVLGWVLNDSGVVVTAMVLIFVPAVVTTAALPAWPASRSRCPSGPGPRRDPPRAGGRGGGGGVAALIASLFGGGLGPRCLGRPPGRAPGALAAAPQHGRPGGARRRRHRAGPRRGPRRRR